MQNTHSLIFDKVKEIGLSDYRISKLSGVDARIIGNYRRNPDYNITADRLLKIANTIGIQLQDKITVVNELGLYLEQLDIKDYAFTTDYLRALKFLNKEEAEYKIKMLPNYKGLKIK